MVAHLCHSTGLWFIYMVRPDGKLAKDKVIAGVPAPFRHIAEHVVRASEVVHDFIHAESGKKPQVTRAVDALPPDMQDDSRMLLEGLGMFWEGGKRLGEKVAGKQEQASSEQAIAPEPSDSDH
jgi:hypothetical protein